MSTSFIGQDLTLSAYEKAQIDKANAAQPTNMANTGSELDSMRRDIDELEKESSSSIDNDDLPF